MFPTRVLFIAITILLGCHSPAVVREGESLAAQPLVGILYEITVSGAMGYNRKTFREVHVPKLKLSFRVRQTGYFGKVQIVEVFRPEDLPLIRPCVYGGTGLLMESRFVELPVPRYSQARKIKEIKIPRRLAKLLTENLASQSSIALVWGQLAS